MPHGRERIMAASWYPVIDPDLCSNCYRRVEFCSHGVFEVGEDQPVVSHPEACVEFCRGCSKICPNEPISYLSGAEKIPLWAAKAV
jgi:NAD-dependent dihydropyrimidine dehydrogenase PreA subunit